MADNFLKKKRTVDRALLDHCQGKPCLICGHEETTVGHHIITKGAGGPDEAWNLVPLCHVHHDQIHRLKTTRFAEIHPEFHEYLKYWGWGYIYTKNRGKWLQPK